MFVKIKNFFISIYEILKRKVIGAYVLVKNWLVDRATGEVVNEQVVKAGEALASGLDDQNNVDVSTVCVNKFSTLDLRTITYEEIPASEEKLQSGLEALASFVAKYSTKGSLVTADIMYMAFVSDPNTLPQGYKGKLYSFFLKHQEELVALSLKVEGTELIPLKQYRSFCKDRMFTSDSVYSKARYSNEFYEMVKNQ